MNQEQLSEARSLREAGNSYAAIGRQLSIPPTTVQRNLKPFEPPQTDDPYEAGPSVLAELDPGDVAAEIRLMRIELKKARDAGAPAIVLGQQASVIGKLSKDYIASAVRSGKMLHFEKCKEYVSELAALFVAEFIDACPDAHERVDKIIARVAPPINDKKQTHELLGRER